MLALSLDQTVVLLYTSIVGLCQFFFCWTLRSLITVATPAFFSCMAHIQFTLITVLDLTSMNLFKIMSVWNHRFCWVKWQLLVVDFFGLSGQNLRLTQWVKAKVGQNQQDHLIMKVFNQNIRYSTGENKNVKVLIYHNIWIAWTVVYKIYTSMYCLKRLRF